MNCPPPGASSAGRFFCVFLHFVLLFSLFPAKNTGDTETKGGNNAPRNYCRINSSCWAAGRGRRSQARRTARRRSAECRAVRFAAGAKQSAGAGSHTYASTCGAKHRHSFLLPAVCEGSSKTGGDHSQFLGGGSPERLKNREDNGHSAEALGSCEGKAESSSE